MSFFRKSRRPESFDPGFLLLLSLMYDCTVSGPSFIVLYIFLTKFHISFFSLTSVFAYILPVTRLTWIDHGLSPFSF